MKNAGSEEEKNEENCDDEQDKITHNYLVRFQFEFRWCGSVANEPRPLEFCEGVEYRDTQRSVRIPSRS